VKIRECEIGTTVWVQGLVVEPNVVDFGGGSRADLRSGKQVSPHNGGGNDLLLRSQVEQVIQRHLDSTMGNCNCQACGPLRERGGHYRQALQAVLEEVRNIP